MNKPGDVNFTDAMNRLLRQWAKLDTDVGRVAREVLRARNAGQYERSAEFARPLFLVAAQAADAALAPAITSQYTLSDEERKQVAALIRKLDDEEAEPASDAPD